MGKERRRKQALRLVNEIAEGTLYDIEEIVRRSQEISKRTPQEPDQPLDQVTKPEKPDAGL